MTTSKAGEVALKSGRSWKRKWIFSKEEMKNMASLREGLDEFKELQFRQQSTKFIQLLGDRLNHGLKEQRFKITQLCMCAAMIHMHRFFYFHSFTFFDYRDVAAACLFLSGKSEECPRKIDYIVRAWWDEKFPGVKLDQQKYEDAMGLLVMIEGIVLQTIDFDLQVALPHPLVLRAMHGIATNDNKKITGVAYFFATDVLCVTSWPIRYSAEAIAVACVQIVCAWADFKMPVASDGAKWYQKHDPTMTEEQLQEMQREFVAVYSSCKNELAITKFMRKGEIRGPPSSSDRSRHSSQADVSEGRLPPPPPPPSISMDGKPEKKVDITAYKERRAADGARSSSSSSSQHHHDSRSHAAAGSAHSQQQQQQQRRSFMPDMNTTKSGGSASMPGFVRPKEESVDRKPEIKREIKHEGSPYRSSSYSQQRPARPPSNSSSGGAPPSHHQQHRSSSSQNPYMQQSQLLQQPSSSGGGRDRSMEMAGGGGERGREWERERGDKRKREMSGSSHNSDKRQRTDMTSSGSGGGQQRGHSTLPPSSSQQRSHGSQQLQHNSGPPLQQPS